MSNLATTLGFESSNELIVFLNNSSEEPRRNSAGRPMIAFEYRQSMYDFWKRNPNISND